MNAYLSSPNFQPLQRSGSVEEARRALQSAYDKAQHAAQEAIRLDPRYVDGYVALARIEIAGGKWSDAEAHYQQALITGC